MEESNNNETKIDNKKVKKSNFIKNIKSNYYWKGWRFYRKKKSF